MYKFTGESLVIKNFSPITTLNQYNNIGSLKKITNEYDINIEKENLLFFEIESEYKQNVEIIFNDCGIQVGKFIMINQKEYFYNDQWFNKRNIIMGEGINKYIWVIPKEYNISEFSVEIKSYRNKVLNKKYGIKSIENVNKKYLINATLRDDEILDIKVNSDFIDNSSLEELSVVIYEERYNLYTKQYDRIILLDFVSKFNETKSINLKKFNLLNTQSILIGVGKDDNDYHSDKFYIDTYKRIILRDYESIVKDLKKEINLILKKYKNKWFFEQIKYYSLSIEQRQEDLETNYILYKMWFTYFNEVRKYNSLNEYLNYPGYKTLYFISYLDKKVTNISVHVPNEYYRDFKHDCLLIISSSHPNAHIEKFSKRYKNKIIIETTSRGVTFGNYISEASFFEAYDIIKKIYNINKLYLIGYSSCASTVYKFITKYPHLFDGGVMFSGMYNLNYLHNANNKKMIFVYGEKDENCDFYRNMNNLMSNEKFHNIEIEEVDHKSIYLFLDNEDIIKLLYLEVESQNNNKNIFTHHELDCMIEGKIEILKVDKENNSFECEYKVENNTLILNTKNVKYLKIKNNSYEKVILNNESFIINFNETYFEISDGSVFVLNPPIEINKRRLIIDIYKNEMEVYYNKRNVKQILRNFCSPITMGYIHKININYPITYMKNYDKLNIVTNAVVYGYNVNSYDDNNIIKCYNDYFEYNRKKYYGKYVVIQAVQSLWNEKRTIVFINSNHIGSLRNNFYIRNIIIPSDLSENEYPFKNAAIIFYNNKYFYVRTLSEKIDLKIKRSKNGKEI